MLSLHTANPKVRAALGFDGMFQASIKARLVQSYATNARKMVQRRSARQRIPWRVRKCQIELLKRRHLLQ